MAVSETLTLIDKVTAPAQRMTTAMSGLESVTKRVQSQLAKIGGKRELAKIEQPLRAGGKALNDWDRMVKKATADLSREHKVAAVAARQTQNMGSAAKGATGAVKRLGAKDALGAFGLGGAIGSGIFTAVLALGAVARVVKSTITAATDLATAFGEGVINAVLLREKAKAFFDTLSGGKGATVLELIKQQAIKLGQPFEELKAQVQDARDSGLSFREAFKLNLIRADILATGRSVEETEGAINKMLDDVHKKKKPVGKALRELKEDFGVVGDGAAAAKRATETFTGVWERITRAPGLLLDLVAKKLGPTFDNLAPKATAWLDKMLVKGGPVEKFIDKLVVGVQKFIDIAIAGAQLIAPFWKGLKLGLGPLIEAFDTIGRAIGKAFGSDKAATMSTLTMIAKGLGVAIGVVVGVTAGMVAVFGALVAAAAAPFVLFGAIISKLNELTAAAYNAGRGMIDGLVNGIRDGIGRAVAVAQQLAGAVKNAVASALRLGSPSKVFEDIGGNVAAGFARGIEGGAGDAARAGRQLAVAPASAAASGGGGAGRAAGGGMTLNVNVSAMPGATKEDGERLASGLVPIIRREVASFFEGAMLEAGA